MDSCHLLRVVPKTYFWDMLLLPCVDVCTSSASRPYHQDTALAVSLHYALLTQRHRGYQQKLLRPEARIDVYCTRLYTVSSDVRGVSITYHLRLSEMAQFCRHMGSYNRCRQHTRRTSTVK